MNTFYSVTYKTLTHSSYFIFSIWLLIKIYFQLILLTVSVLGILYSFTLFYKKISCNLILLFLGSVTIKQATFLLPGYEETSHLEIIQCARILNTCTSCNLCLTYFFFIFTYIFLEGHMKYIDF